MCLTSYWLLIYRLGSTLMTQKYIDDTEDHVNIQLDNIEMNLLSCSWQLDIDHCIVCCSYWNIDCWCISYEHSHCPLYDKNGIHAIFIGTWERICSWHIAVSCLFLPIQNGKSWLDHKYTTLSAVVLL